MFVRSATSRFAWLALLCAAFGALLVVAGTGPAAVQYFYSPYAGYPYGSLGDFAATQDLARGAQQRAIAREMRDLAIARLNGTVGKGYDFDMVIVGCSLHHGRYWCP